MKVIITRPAEQQSFLQQGLQQLGCQVVSMPTLKIVAEDETGELKQKCLDIDHYSAVIAISANAAHFGVDYLDRYWPQPPVKINWLAVGPATAEVMQQAGLVTQMPDSQFDSEGLLQLECLQQPNISGQKILIWRGVGGRETLASTLRQRGAQVDYAELYQRLVPSYTQDEWQIAAQQADLLVVSSGQGLQAVMQQCSDLAKHCPTVLAPSERVAKIAKEFGFADVVKSVSARDQDTLQAVQYFIEQQQ